MLFFRHLIVFLLVIAASSTFLCRPILAQPSQEIFGKRRIQYKQRDWEFISSTNFDIYYYQNGRELANLAAQFAEAEFERTTELIGFSPYTKIKLYIYNSLADLRESNIGLDDENSSSGGKTNFVKSIIEIPFPGNQIAFRKEICMGMARTLVLEMMYGGSLKDVVQNSYLLNLPEWFIGGVTQYAAEGWSLEMDDYIRDALLNNRISKPGHLTGQEARLAGQSIWNFIAEKYTRASIGNILNLTRIVRNEETSIGNTLGISFDRLIREWRNYYLNMAENANGSYVMPDHKFLAKRHNRRKLVFNEVKLSRSGKLLAYSFNNDGRYHVVLQEADGHRRKTIFSGGYKLLTQRIEYTEPHLAFQADEAVHAVVNKNGKLWLETYTIANGNHSKMELQNFNAVTGFDVSPDGKHFIFSAEKDGAVDLFLLNLKTGATTRLTHDFYDDLEPKFAGSIYKIVFSSNRLNDSVQTRKVYERDIFDNFNIFILQSGSPTFERFTNTIHNERAPIWNGDSTLFFLSDDKGIVNISKLDLHTGKRYAVSEYRQNILSYDANHFTGGLAFRMMDDGREYIFSIPNYGFPTEINRLPTHRQEVMDDILAKKNGASLIQGLATRQDSLRSRFQANLLAQHLDTLGKDEIDIRNYVFENEKVKKISLPRLAPSVADQKKVEKKASKWKDPIASLGLTGPFVYRNRLSMDNVVTSPYFDQLLGTGILGGTGMTDMFENHKLKATALIITDLKSSRMNLDYQFLKHRVDFNAGFTKNSYFLQTDNFENRISLVKVEAGATLPFNIFSSINVTPFFAQTKYTTLGFSNAQLSEPDIFNGYGGIKSEFVFDNTLAYGLNTVEGLKLRLRYETYSGLKSQSLSFSSVYADVRYYLPVHREVILAFRGSGGRYMGPARKNYMIGGMDNWINNKTETTQKPEDPLNIDNLSANGKTDWLFNQFVTDMRGFNYNQMYGNSFLLFNAELRIPIIRYLYQGQITNNFLRNLQFVAFTDAGTAFSGNSPFNSDNSYNTRQIQYENATTYNPFIITVTNFRNPFLMSYGGGVRSVLLGYYIKMDIAQGIKDYQQQSVKWYFTLGYDF